MSRQNSEFRVALNTWRKLPEKARREAIALLEDETKQSEQWVKEAAESARFNAWCHRDNAILLRTGLLAALNLLLKAV